MRRIRTVSLLLDGLAIVSGLCGILLERLWLLFLAAALMAAGLLYTLLRFRCPFCHRFVGIGNYRPHGFCLLRQRSGGIRPLLISDLYC